MEKKIVEYNYVTGHLSNVLLHLKMSVGILLSFNKEVKVGITGRDSQDRFDEHLKNYDWDRMIVKYITSSDKNANVLEDYLIGHYPQLVNKWIGTSNLSQEGYNYLYILLKK